MAILVNALLVLRVGLSNERAAITMLAVVLMGAAGALFVFGAWRRRHLIAGPGPIASPGRASIEAAASPADVPYLYFVSRNDGSHVFSATLDEHNRNVFEYQVKPFREPAATR